MSTPTCTLNTGDLWCGVVTVGDIIVSGVTAGHGFSAIVGELSDKTFDVGTNSYTIDGVIVGSADVGAAGDLTFSLTSALTATDKEKLVLHVGSSSFAFSDAGAPTSTFGYAWPPSSLDWSSETSVTLRLREANNAPVFAATINDARRWRRTARSGTNVGAVIPDGHGRGQRRHADLQPWRGRTRPRSPSTPRTPARSRRSHGRDLQPRGGAEQLLGDGEGVEDGNGGTATD